MYSEDDIIIESGSLCVTKNYIYNRRGGCIIPPFYLGEHKYATKKQAIIEDSNNSGLRPSLLEDFISTTAPIKSSDKQCSHDTNIHRFHPLVKFEDFIGAVEDIKTNAGLASRAEDAQQNPDSLSRIPFGSEPPSGGSTLDGFAVLGNSSTNETSIPQEIEMPLDNIQIIVEECPQDLYVKKTDIMYQLYLRKVDEINQKWACLVTYFSNISWFRT